MKSKTSPVSGHARNSQLQRNGRLAAVLLGLVTFAAACGGPAIPGYVNGTPGSPVAFAQCMRAHGVPGFPNPSNGSWNLAGINQNSPQFRRAAGICGSSGPGSDPSQQAQGLAEGLAFSRCMRAHGVHNYADPTAGTNGGISTHVSSGSGVDRRSPAFQAALRACRSVLPNGGNSGSGNSGSAA